MKNNPNKSIQEKINFILEELQKHPYADKIYIVGSVAKGSKKPGDLDIFVDLRDKTIEEQDFNSVSEILRLASRSSGNYGSFDPFIMFKDVLIVRNDEANGWMRAINSEELQKSFLNDKVPLGEIKSI